MIYSALFIYILVMPSPTPEVAFAGKHHKHKQNRLPFKNPHVMLLDWKCHILVMGTDRLQTTRVSKKYL